jgi:hypothetical protein
VIDAGPWSQLCNAVVPKQIKQHVVQFIMTLEPERVLLRSISVLIASETSSAVMEIQVAPHGQSFSHLPLVMDDHLHILRGASTNWEARGGESSHSRVVLDEVIRTSSHVAILSSGSPPQHLSSKCLPADAAALMSNVAITSSSDSAQDAQALLSTAVNFNPSSFSDASPSFNTTDPTAQSSRKLEAALHKPAASDILMAFLEEVELDPIETADGDIPVIPTAECACSPRRKKTLHSHALDVDTSTQALQATPTATSPGHATPSGTTSPFKNHLATGWGSIAATDAGSITCANDMVQSLVASGIELCTPPPLLFDSQKAVQQADTSRALQHISPTVDSMNYRLNPSVASSTMSQRPPEQYNPPCKRASSATDAVASDTPAFMHTLASRVEPQINLSVDRRSPLFSSSTPSANFQSLVPISHCHARLQCGEHLQTSIVQHCSSTALLTSSCFSPALDPSSCQNHFSVPVVQSASTQQTSASTVSFQDNFGTGATHLQQETRALHSAHSNSVAGRSQADLVPMQEALTNAILSTTDTGMLRVCTGGCKAKTPSFKRLGCENLRSEAS